MKTNIKIAFFIASAMLVIALPSVVIGATTNTFLETVDKIEFILDAASVGKDGQLTVEWTIKGNGEGDQCTEVFVDGVQSEAPESENCAVIKRTLIFNETSALQDAEIIRSNFFFSPIVLEVNNISIKWTPNHFKNWWGQLNSTKALVFFGEHGAARDNYDEMSSAPYLYDQTRNYLAYTIGDISFDLGQLVFDVTKESEYINAYFSEMRRKDEVSWDTAFKNGQPIVAGGGANYISEIKEGEDPLEAKDLILRDKSTHIYESKDFPQYRGQPEKMPNLAMTYRLSSFSFNFLTPEGRNASWSKRFENTLHVNFSQIQP